MSAQQDRSQPIAFYFGNAAKDLAHLLPVDEYAPETHTAVTSLAALDELLDAATQKLDELVQHRREVAFLLFDLKRMLS